MGPNHTPCDHHIRYFEDVEYTRQFDLRADGTPFDDDDGHRLADTYAVTSWYYFCDKCFTSWDAAYGPQGQFPYPPAELQHLFYPAPPAVPKSDNAGR